MSNQIVSDNCPICLEEIVDCGRNMIATECGHKFHYTCLIKHTGKGCPCCRAVLPSSSVATVDVSSVLTPLQNHQRNLAAAMERHQNAILRFQTLTALSERVQVSAATMERVRQVSAGATEQELQNRLTEILTDERLAGRRHTPQPLATEQRRPQSLTELNNLTVTIVDLTDQVEQEIPIPIVAQEQEEEQAVHVDRFEVPVIDPLMNPRDRIRDIAVEIARVNGQLMGYYERVCGKYKFSYNSADEVADIISLAVKNDAPAFRKQCAADGFIIYNGHYKNRSRRSAGIKAERAFKKMVKTREMVQRTSERVSAAATRALGVVSNREFKQSSAVFERAVAKFASYHESGLWNVTNTEQELTSYKSAKNEFVNIIANYANL